MSQETPDPMEPNPYAVEVQDAQLVESPPPAGDGTGGLIPYKNPAALAAYYLGLFSLFPVLGLFLAIPALVLGIAGLRARKRDPAIKGSVHAWIGIVMGGIFTLVWGALAILIVVALWSQA
jgi:hypothetical protein